MNAKTETGVDTPWGWCRRRLAVLNGVLLLGLAAGGSSAQTYRVLFNFPATDWHWSGQTLLTSGSELFGTRCAGGAYNKGIIFRIDENGDGYTVLKSFTGGEDGGGPLGLVLSGTTLYGTTFYGGSSDLGTVFRMNTDGSEFTVLRSFTGYPGDGANCNRALLLSGATLYGTSLYAGAHISGGTVFRINIDGSGYAVIHSFGGGKEDGAYPAGDLALTGTTLYGITGGGGSANQGTIYRVNTDGSHFALLKSFTRTNNDGYTPESGLMLSENTLYGTTLWCGGGGLGTVYKVNTDGSGYAVLKQFVENGEGANPSAGLVASGPTLYGMAEQGGGYGKGVVFAVSTDGGGYTVLKDFNGEDGACPNMPLALSAMRLYGMTEVGGLFDGGVLFSLSIAPPTFVTPPESQTAEAGSTVNFVLDVDQSLPMTCQWYLGGTELISCNRYGDPPFTNVQYSSSGTYVVVVSNLFGSVTSSPVMLNVIAPVARRPVPGIYVNGDAESPLTVTCANSLSPAVDWLVLDTVRQESPSPVYLDLTFPLPRQRFYRIWQTETPGVIPALDLHWVPAITLMGNVGDTLRLDFINAIGPTDAWVTLDTVMLTNASQLRFDTSSMGQPRRLYRIVPLP